MMRWVTLAAIALGACVPPPAKPDTCEAAITTAYTRVTLAALDVQVKDFESARGLGHDRDFARSVLYWQAYGNEWFRKQTIHRCIADQWPSPIARCYFDASSFEAISACNDKLPDAACRKLDDDTRDTEYGPSMCARQRHRR